MTCELIRSRKRMRTIRDFAGLRFGTIWPTDIDGFVDFGNRAFVFIEMKHGDSEPLRGQRLALERLCDACERGGIKSLVLIASHNTDGDIDVANSQVTEERYGGKWRKPKHPATVRQRIDAFREFAMGSKPKGLEGLGLKINRCDCGDQTT